MKKNYSAIDGLRTLAAIGILMMHIAANNQYKISGLMYNSIIPSLGNFVFLFMLVSAFGMCCGYYDKVLQNKIYMPEFYSKRFKKILPFFGILVLLDISISHSIDSLYEGFADLTLLFGFLPDAGDITVIGVGWFLGLVFVFYLCFPFFCFLLENKRRAWMAFGISLIYNYVCSRYFEVGRSNILYSACFFLVGGLIYLYREKIEELNRWSALGIVIASVILYYVIGGNVAMYLLVSSTMLVYAVIVSDGLSSTRLPKASLLQNRFTKFISGISMEIYLSHMVIFRVVEKVGLNRKFGDGWVQYITTVVVVICGTIIFAVMMQRVIGIVRKMVEEKKLLINKSRQED